MHELAKYTTCDVADGLTKFNIPDSGFFPDLTAYSESSTTIVGPAYTVLYAPLSDPRPAIPYIEKVPSGHVVVVATTRELQCEAAPHTRLANALYGGLMSTRAQYLGAAGTVVFGRIRDVQEHRALRYPVWAWGVGVAAPRSAAKVVAVNEAVDVLVQNGESHWRQICPGDLIVADASGVVRVPMQDKALLHKLCEYVPKRVAADELVAADIKNGEEAGKSQKKRRQHL